MQNSVLSIVTDRSQHWRSADGNSLAGQVGGAVIIPVAGGAEAVSGAIGCSQAIDIDKGINQGFIDSAQYNIKTVRTQVANAVCAVAESVAAVASANFKISEIEIMAIAMIEKVVAV